MVGISMEVLSKDICILTPFGPIQPLQITFVLSKEAGSNWDYDGQFNLSWELS